MPARARLLKSSVLTAVPPGVSRVLGTDVPGAGQGDTGLDWLLEAPGVAVVDAGAAAAAEAFDGGGVFGAVLDDIATSGPMRASSTSESQSRSSAYTGLAIWPGAHEPKTLQGNLICSTASATVVTAAT